MTGDGEVVARSASVVFAVEFGVRPVPRAIVAAEASTPPITRVNGRCGGVVAAEVAVWTAVLHGLVGGENARLHFSQGVFPFEDSNVFWRGLPTIPVVVFGNVNQRIITVE